VAELDLGERVEHVRRAIAALTQRDEPLRFRRTLLLRCCDALHHTPVVHREAPSAAAHEVDPTTMLDRDLADLDHATVERDDEIVDLARADGRRHRELQRQRRVVDDVEGELAAHLGSERGGRQGSGHVP